MTTKRTVVSTKVSTPDLSVKINGVSLPYPSKFKIEFYDIQDNEYRDSNGVIHFAFVRRNLRKAFLEWQNIDRDKAKVILESINSSNWLTISYPNDPLTKTRHEFTGYVGNRSSDYYSFNPNYDVYTSLTFNLIEK